MNRLFLEAGEGERPKNIPALTVFLLLSHTQPLPKEEALAPRGGTGCGAVGPGSVLITGRGDFNGWELQVFLAGGRRILIPAGLQALLLHFLHPPHLEALPAQGWGGRTGPGTATFHHLLLWDLQCWELQGFCHIGSWHQMPFLFLLPPPGTLGSDLGVNHTTKPQLAFLLPHPVQYCPPSQAGNLMFFTCFHLTNSRVGRGCSGHRHATREASFKFLFSFSSQQNKVPPLPGLSQSSRFSTETRAASNSLAHFQLPPHLPFAFCPFCLMLAQERKISWGSARKLSRGLLERRSKYGVERRGAVRRSERETKRGREATILDKNQEKE